LVLPLLGSSWVREGCSSIGVLGGVTCGLATITRYDVACGLARGVVGRGGCYGRNIFFLLAVLSSRCVGILSLLALFIYLAGLRRYIVGDREDLTIRGFEHVVWVVGGDGCASDLERAAVRGRRTIDLATMSRN
jgi:hypothetical protein